MLSMPTQWFYRTALHFYFSRTNEATVATEIHYVRRRTLAALGATIRLFAGHLRHMDCKIGFLTLASRQDSPHSLQKGRRLWIGPQIQLDKDICYTTTALWTTITVSVLVTICKLFERSRAHRALTMGHILPCQKGTSQKTDLGMDHSRQFQRRSCTFSKKPTQTAVQRRGMTHHWRVRECDVV